MLEGLMFVTVVWDWRLAVVAHGGLACWLMKAETVG